MFPIFLRPVLKKEECFALWSPSSVHPRALFLVYVANLRSVTLQTRRMFHTFAWSVLRRDECFNPSSSLSGLCPKGNVFSRSPLKFEECFTLSRGRYPTVTNGKCFTLSSHRFCQCIVELFGIILNPREQNTTLVKPTFRLDQNWFRIAS